MQRDATTWNRHRRWYQSRYWTRRDEGPQGSMLADDTSPETMIETNYPYAFIDTMIANVCPLNPQVTVHARRESAKASVKVRETLANETLRREDTHDKLWRISSCASLYPRGWMKVVWDGRRMAPKYRVIDPRRVFFDQSAESWEDVRYIVEVLTLTKSEFDARCKRRAGGRIYSGEATEKARFDAYPKWLQDEKKNTSMIHGEADSAFRWCVIYEFHDFTGEGSFSHMIEECEEPLLEEGLPYDSVKNPYKLLTFNDNMEDIGGMSDVQLIEGLQEQLNELDTLELAWYKANIPVAMVDTGKLSDPDGFKTAYANSSQPGAFIDVKTSAAISADISEVVKFTPTPSVLLGFQQKREQLVRQIEFLLGIPQYSRGVVGVADVATEVALSDAATRTRNGRRQKKIFDIVKWMGETAVALYQENLPNDATIQARSGPTKPPIEITRTTAGMPKLLRRDDPEWKPVVAPADWDFEAVPYSSVENNRMIQLRNMRDSWPMLVQGMQMSVVDPRLVFEKLADALMITDTLTDPEAVAQGAVPAGAGMPAPSLGEDTRASGALPPGTEPPGVPLPFGGAGNGGAAPIQVARGTSAFPEG